MLYNFGVRLYGAAIRLVSLYNPKARKWVEGRKNFWRNLPVVSDQNVAWFHCASLGEFEQGRPVIQRWKKENPGDFILVTFFSPSGYEIKKEDKIADFICYLPLDTPKNAKRFINHFNPVTAFFVKYEFWVNYISAAKENNTKLYAVSASFRKDQRFFKWYGQKFRNALQNFDRIFVQRQKSAELLKSIGINRVTVAGDTRYDRVANRLDSQIENYYFEDWISEDEKVLVIGSSWPSEEEILIPLINNGSISEKVILAPHEVDEKHILEIISKLNVPFERYTELNESKKINSETRVVILDCIGVLAEAYKYGNIAYVGGGFGTGLHNILEPAIFGLPVIFGPKHKKFPEAKDFMFAEIGASISNEQEFLAAYDKFMSDKNINRRATEFMQRSIGATDKIFSQIKKPSK